MYKTEEQRKDQFNQLVEWLGDCEDSSAEKKWNDEAEEDYKFYSGDQDTTEVKEALEAQSRPCTVYNEIMPKINMLVGMAAQMEGGLTLMPRTLEDAPLTELMTGTMEFFREKMRLNRKENNCFEHAVKSGKSWLHFYIDENSPDDTIKAQRVPGRDIHHDPDSVEFDLSDCRFLFRDKWFTADDIEAAWPDFSFARDSAGNVVTDNFNAVRSTSGYVPTFFNEASDKHRIVEVWWRKYETKYTVQNPITGQPEELFEEEYNEFKASMKEGIELPDGTNLQHDDFPAVETMARTMWYAIFNGMEILEISRSVYQHGTFPYVYLEAYHDEDNNCAKSVVNTMKDPQRGLNTTRRQLIHLLQTAPKGMLLHEVGAVLNIEDYEEKSSKPGFHMELSKGGLEKIKFTDQPQISPIYAQLDGLFQQSMKDSSGIQDALLGIQTSTREPGITARMRHDSSVAVLHVLFDNYKEFKYICSKILISLIQQFITTEQIIRIKGQQGYMLMEINTQTNPQSEGWNDVSAAQFDLIIDEDVVTKSTRLAVAQMLTEFNGQNPGTIPPDLMLEYANLPYTAQTRVRQHTQRQEQNAMAQAQGEQALEAEKLSLESREVQVKEDELDHKIEVGFFKPKPSGGGDNG